MDLFKIKKIYMIGIKGVGMTMLAQFLVGKGYDVSGSDVPEVFLTDQVLKKEKIKVIEGFGEKNIPKDADLIIYSSAYNEKTNVEVAEALKSGRKILSFAQALGSFFNQYYGIAVAGSHGKTTTTAWLGYVLHKSGLNPNVMVGSRVPQFDGSSLVGNSDILIAETDEYQNKFQYFNPKAIILNNIEYDHPDFFPSFDDYLKVFIEFLKKIPKKGFLIANYDDSVIKRFASVNCLGKVISYGIKEEGDYSAYDIRAEKGKTYFKVKLKDNGEESLADNFLGDFSISLAGQHNVYNALAVIVASIELGVELTDIRTYLEEFQGTARRMEIMGKFKGAIIIDDYAHHPTEIKATLAALREKYKANEIVAVFHPHTFSRTKAMLDDFSKSFALADQVIVLDIYGSAREKQGGVHSRDLLEKIKKVEPGKNALYLPDLFEVEKYLRQNIKKDQIIALMGAGDVFRIGEKLIKDA